GRGMARPLRAVSADSSRLGRTRRQRGQEHPDRQDAGLRVGVRSRDSAWLSAYSAWLRHDTAYLRSYSAWLSRCRAKLGRLWLWLWLRQWLWRSGRGCRGRERPRALRSLASAPSRLDPVGVSQAGEAAEGAGRD